MESKVPTDNVDTVDRLINYFSNLYRLKLATCWMLRFVNYWKEKTCTTRGIEIHTGPISVEELEMAEIALVKYVQATHYSDWINHLQGKSNKRLIKSSPLWKLNPILVEGLMRVGGRLGNASFSFDTKHPVILPENSSLTQLIIEHYHCHNVAHSGVNTTLNALRQRFWIENGRVTTRIVLAKCLFCIRRSARPAEQLMAELPPARLQSGEPPFTHSGSDCFGPFIVKHKRSELKRYGCIFICMTTRAIHLEVLPDLTTDSFINALRRFIARRGPLTHLYTDNGSNFVGAERILREEIQAWNREKINEYLRQRSIVWKFNPPTASHMGGSWERGIRSVRRILQAVTPNKGKGMDDDALLTVFCEVETIVNSRPLTDVSIDVEEELPLTPNHLLRINPEIALPPIVSSDKDCYARNRYRVVQFVADEFWRRWSKEYTSTLIKRQKWFHKKRNVCLGDIVLVVDDNSARGQWPIGRIVELCPDRHGLVRSVMVKTQKGCFHRPISKLCPIVTVME